MFTIAENFALANILTEWPDGMTYDDILSGIDNGHEDIVIYEPFEQMLAYEVIEQIELLRVSFLSNVKEITKGLRDAIKNGDPLTIAEQLAAFEQQIGE